MTAVTTVLTMVITYIQMEILTSAWRSVMPMKNVMLFLPRAMDAG